MDSVPIILGLNTVYHETSACLLHGPSVLAFAEEERFNRVKHAKPANVDNPDVLPVNAINYCLARAGITWKSIDYVAISFDPSLRRPPIAESTTEGSWGTPLGEAVFLGCLRKLPSRISELAQRDMRDCIRWVPHELAHAASAYFTSPFDEAAVLSIDGIGESSTSLLAHGLGTTLNPLRSIKYPNSLGFVWEKMSQFLGFGPYDAGKVMALAAFGSLEKFGKVFSKLISLTDEGFEVESNAFGFRVEDFVDLERIFGKQRSRDDYVGPREAAIAAALQQSTEEVLLHLADMLRKETGCTRLCVAGGVALNCIAMGRIQKESPFKELFIPPVVHDAGTALGAAFHTLYEAVSLRERYILESPFIGPEFSDRDMEEALRNAEIPYAISDNIAVEAASLLTQGALIGWFQGAAEIGPRALGNRSILADPRRAASKDLINLKVKHREFFRPYAPAVLEEAMAEWFEIPRFCLSSRFMSIAYPVQPQKCLQIPAVVHVDGTCRVQSVAKTVNPAFHALISAFEAQTGVPILLNTSFNTYDEPIVCSPGDAIRTYLRTDLDALILGNHVALKWKAGKNGPIAL